jgi:hypothetical protein
MMRGSAVASGAAIAVLAFGFVLGRGSDLFWGCAALALAVVFFYGTFRSARAFTQFGPVGVRTRGQWGGTDEYRWDQIANVAMQQVTYPSGFRTGTVWSVVVTTRAGDHVRLGAPVSTTGTGPEFTAEFRQIRTVWQDATGITETPGTAPRAWSREALWLGAAIGVQVLALAVVFVTLPYFSPAWAAHEGEGHAGVFTAALRNCPQAACSWFGTFTTATSRAKYVTLEPGGPAIYFSFQTVDAVDTGRNGIVWRRDRLGAPRGGSHRRGNCPAAPAGWRIAGSDLPSSGPAPAGSPGLVLIRMAAAVTVIGSGLADDERPDVDGLGHGDGFG